MVATLRSGVNANNEDSSTEEILSYATFSEVDAMVAKFEDVLLPLSENISGITSALDEIRQLFENKFKKQQIVIDNLLTRVCKLESDAKLNRHISRMQERKLDDQEQVSRKINLRIEGIPVRNEDSPRAIMNVIQAEVKKLNIEVPENEFDRVHRVGSYYFDKNGNKQQAVLLKLTFWRTRDVIYENRKRFPFKILPDLTKRRKDLLTFAINAIENGKNRTDEAISRTVDFAMCDQNCHLKVRGKDKSYHSFNSEDEFFSIIVKLDNKLCFTQEMVEDEANWPIYY